MMYAKDGKSQKAGAKELLESALRMRPDRILLQELRDGTAFFYLRNVNSGHPGSITTVHANTAEGALEQLTLLVKESEGGNDLDRHDIRALLRSLVDIVVQMHRLPRRRANRPLPHDRSLVRSGQQAPLTEVLDMTGKMVRNPAASQPAALAFLFLVGLVVSMASAPLQCCGKRICSPPTRHGRACRRALGVAHGADRLETVSAASPSPSWSAWSASFLDVRQQKLHGEARWAQIGEVRKAS
jgi:hypothetical protein